MNWREFKWHDWLLLGLVGSFGALSVLYVLIGGAALAGFVRSAATAAWVQALGSIAAILGAVFVSRDKERRDHIRAQKIAVIKARNLVGSVEAVLETVQERPPHAVADIAYQRVVLKLSLEQAAGIESGVLELPWIVAIHGLRAIAAQMLEAIEQFEAAPRQQANPALADPVHLARLVALFAHFHQGEKKLRETVAADYPGLNPYEPWI